MRIHEKKVEKILIVEVNGNSMNHWVSLSPTRFIKDVEDRFLKKGLEEKCICKFIESQYLGAKFAKYEACWEFLQLDSDYAYIFDDYKESIEWHNTMVLESAFDRSLKEVLGKFLADQGFGRRLR